MMSHSQYDIAIIGAGINGVMAAYQALTQDPSLKIILIDKSLHYQGATRYSLGVDLPFGITECKRDYTLQSRKLWHELNERHPALARRPLSLSIITSESNPKVAHDSLTELGEYDSLSLFPNHHCYNNLTAYVFDTQAVTQSLQMYLYERHGLDLLSGISVENCDITHQVCQLSLSNRQTIFARHVIAALGPWITSSCFNNYLPKNLVRTKKIVAFQVDAPFNLSEKVYYFSEDDAFLAPSYCATSAYFSITVQDWDCLPVPDTLSVSESNTRQAQTTLSQYLPKHAVKLTGSRVFCDAYAQDFTPLIINEGHDASLQIITACSGSGFRLAPAISHAALGNIGVL